MSTPTHPEAGRDKPDNVIDLLVQVPRVSGNPFGFVLDHQTALQTRDVGRDTGGTTVLVAAQRLDAAERKHVAAGGIDAVGAAGQRPGDLGRRHQFAGSDDLDPLAQSALDQGVDDTRQVSASL